MTLLTPSIVFLYFINFYSHLYFFSASTLFLICYSLSSWYECLDHWYSAFFKYVYIEECKLPSKHCLSCISQDTFQVFMVYLILKYYLTHTCYTIYYTYLTSIAFNKYYLICFDVRVYPWSHHNYTEDFLWTIALG